MLAAMLKYSLCILHVKYINILFAAKYKHALHMFLEIFFGNKLIAIRAVKLTYLRNKTD